MLSILMLAGAGTRVSGSVAREFGENDPYGIAMMLIAMAVVFVASIFLFLAFKYAARLSNRNRLRKSRAGTKDHELQEDIPGETLAAISLALHLYHEQMLGLEDAVITFKKAAKTYSPWSSKIYGLRRTPNH